VQACVEVDKRQTLALLGREGISRVTHAGHPIQLASIGGGTDECTLSGVRRAKAALSSGCKPHPATAPAGSNRSSYGGDEIAEAFGMRATNWWQRECAGRNASERRASLVWGF
jgi:hypothetical protein